MLLVATLFCPESSGCGQESEFTWEGKGPGMHFIDVGPHKDRGIEMCVSECVVHASPR